MAISQMKKISIIFPKEILDSLLQTLQELENVHIRELSELEDWQEAFQESRVSLPPITISDSIGQANLTGNDGLAYLSSQQERLENAIERLQRFIPSDGVFKTLRKPDVTHSFEELEAFGQEKSAELLLEQISHKINKVTLLDSQIKENQQSINDLNKWENLQVTPKELESFKFIEAVIGSIPKTADDAPYHQFKNNDVIEFQEVYSSDIDYGVICFFNKNDAVNLEDYHFKKFNYDSDVLPRHPISHMRKEIEQWEAEKSILVDDLMKSQKDLEELKLHTDYVLGLYSRHETKKRLASTENLVALEGWVEEQQLPYLDGELGKQFRGMVFLQENEVDESDWNAVPVKLKNHPLIEPFEVITEMYALPKYYEKDPTPILAPFYFTFFGMMVADLGYGLLLFVATTLILKLFNLPKATRRFMTFFKSLSIAVSLWGMIYGSFFGYTLPIVLISTTSDVMTILVLSVAFGFVTVVVGLFLGGLQKFKMKEYANAYNSGFAWCLILFGLLLLALGIMLPGFSVLSTIGACLAIVNALAIVVVSIAQAKGISGLGSGLFNLYNISSYVGDLVSFTRLMALGLSGASIGSAFNLIVGLFPTPAKFTIGILIFVLLHGINIFLSLLSGYVHGARLMFVEFFGKFYEGGGKAFRPLKSSGKYVKIINKTHVEDK